jgi:flagellin
MRINRASDDAAGLAVASSLNAHSRVYGQGVRNVNDAISALNIADGGLEQLRAITIRQKELAEQAANGSLSRTQRRSLNSEASALQQEYNRIVGGTDFNGLRLLNGSFSQFRIQAGFGISGSLGLSIGSKMARTVGTNGFDNIATLDTAPIGVGTSFNDSAQAVQVDFNGDGILDIVEATTEDATNYSGVAIYLGNANGTFKTPDWYDANTSFAYSIAVGDVNNDGRKDVVVGTQVGPTVFLQLPSGKLSSSSINLAGSNGDSVLVDFNNDGKLDIATAGTTGLSVNLGNGNGTFKSAATYANSSMALQSGDINGDGFADLVTGDQVYLGSNSGAFSAAAAISTGSTQHILSDMNADGALDIVTDKALLLGNGDGTFKAGTTYFAGGGNGFLGQHSVASGDLNGDGHLDIAVTSSSGEVNIFNGNGDGTFATGAKVGGGGLYLSLLLADFNGDDVLDIFGGSLATISSEIYYNTTTTTTTIGAPNITTAQAARESLDILEAQLNRINSERGNIGSAQSRLSSALNTLTASAENSTAAAHRITDIDVASEAANQTRLQILQQVGASVLAQANLAPQIALRLLQ